MLELFSRRHRASDRKKLAAAAAGGAAAACTAVALTRGAQRAHARDRMKSAVGRLLVLGGKARRDARNRATGATSKIARLGRRKSDSASDDKVAARVRSVLGRYASHPHAVEVHAHDGHVVLSGPILAREVRGLLHAVRKVRGVRDVESQLEPHESAENVPALQGAGGIAHAPEIFQEHWTPSLRVAAGTLGALAIAGGAARRHASGAALATAGGLLLARSYFDKPLGRVFGAGPTPRSVEVEKTITIHAPVHEVFSCFADIERFPEFMSHLEQVTRLDERRSHWKVRGPLGTTCEWDAETTAFVPNERIAWKSVGKPRVKSAGLIRFEPVEDGRATRVDVKLAYNPVAGYVGHGVAKLFKVDPKRSLDDDMLRLKSLLEQGKTTAHGHHVTRAPAATPEPAG